MAIRAVHPDPGREVAFRAHRRGEGRLIDALNLPPIQPGSEHRFDQYVPAREVAQRRAEINALHPVPEDDLALQHALRQAGDTSDAERQIILLRRDRSGCVIGRGHRFTCQMEVAFQVGLLLSREHQNVARANQHLPAPPLVAQRGQIPGPRIPLQVEALVLQVIGTKPPM